MALRERPASKWPVIERLGHGSRGGINVTSGVKRALYWAPRILGICFAAFISLFALDVFGEGYTFWETVAALFIHLVPTYLVIGALFLAWRREWIGALLFIGPSLFYLVQVWGKESWLAYLAISGPLFLTGVLFALNWVFRDQLRDR